MPDTDYRFSIGPWNISEGRDSYGPETRPLKDISWKIERFAEAGFDAVMFHDCLLYTSPSPRDGLLSRMPSSA